MGISFLTGTCISLIKHFAQGDLAEVTKTPTVVTSTIILSRFVKSFAFIFFLFQIIFVMAVVVDRADLLFAEISRGLKPIRDVMVVAGLFYLSKKLIGVTYDVWTGIRVFGLSRLWRPDFRKKYGQWAGTSFSLYLPEGS